jgi:cytochrome c oxidase subunit 4
MTPPADAPTDHAPSARAYAIVWVVLVVLATLSLIAAHEVTGSWGLVVALAIAAVKAALVVAVFMHLAGGRPILRIVFVVAVAFAVLLVVGVLGDVGTRTSASPYVNDRGGPP